MAFVVAALTYYVLAVGGVPRLLSFLWVALIAAAAISGVVLVAFRSKREFGWVAVAALIAIGAVASGISYKRNADRPEARPAALLTNSSVGIAGFFVTETSDNVYLARVAPGTSGGQAQIGTGRLIIVPRDERY